MILVTDIGNTSITCAVYENNQYLKIIKIKSDKQLLSKDYAEILSKEFSEIKISECIISSVVKELTEPLKQAVRLCFSVESKILGKDLNPNIKINTKNCKEVGADRLANVYAALKKYSLPAIVVDIGTATTFDIIDKNECFIGGVIMPGVKMQLEALYSNTSLLPNLSPELPAKAIGYDTKSNILSGVIKGHSHAIEGLIEECELELGENANIIITGGYADYVIPNLTKIKYTEEKTLTLDGLVFILQGL